jgi:sugar phosphate isomerase/epimerase
MYKTRTGNLTVGFREVGAVAADIHSQAVWAKAAGFGSIDIVGARAAGIPALLGAGLTVGSIDLPARENMLSPDREQRLAAVAECKSFMVECSEALRSGSPENPLVFWTMMLPSDPSRTRKENYGYMLESYRELNGLLADLDASIVIEGWPGPGCVVCTPEGYRSFLRDCQCDRVGVNYDPSHLIRMGIDPLRFLKEFGPRTYHVHAKDTEILSENLFEYGSEVPAIFEEPIAFGGHSWRYTIPGHGKMRWREAFRILNECGYKGIVSIELEDANFNLGNGTAEKEGLNLGGAFLSGC